MNATSATDGIRRLRAIARLLDESIRLPGGFRIGLDPILGLVPGLGDAVTAIFAAAVIVQSWRLGAPASVLLRMIGNVLLDACAGSVPLLGDVFDAAFKANKRNIDLLESFHADPSAVHRASRQRVLAASILLLLLMLALIALPIAIVVVIVRLV